MSRSKISLISTHILSLLPAPSSPRPPPLFIALQGPQGSGKTYLTSHLSTHLSSPPHNLKLATLSLDDLYLPHSQLLQLKEQNPRNRLLEGRGLPGTHDLILGTRVLDGLRKINDPDGVEVELPVFDKSLHNGQGDRLPPSGARTITGPLDVVIIEGWCMGFSSISVHEIRGKWEGMSREMKEWCGLEDVEVVNRLLEEYEEFWRFFDVFVKIQPKTPSPSSPYAIIYKWRLEQEHYMKAHNSGMGMTDEQVISFVDRYIPGYIFFSDGIIRGPSNTPIPRSPRWLGKSLQITIGEEREYLSHELF